MKKKVFVVVAILALLIGLFLAWWLVFRYNTINTTENVFSILAGILLIILPGLSLIYSRNMESETLYNKKKKIFFLVVNIIILVAGTFLISTIAREDLVYSCTDDCRKVCDLDLECCYADCVSGMCEGSGKDVGYYEERGLVDLSGLSEDQQASFGICPGELPD